MLRLGALSMLAWTMALACRAPSPGCTAWNAGFDVVDQWQPQALADGSEVGIDVHEFQLLDTDQVLVLGLATRQMDLSPWGGQVDGAVLDHIIQEFTPAGDLVFEWSSEGHFDFDEVPEGMFMAPPGMPVEYAHVNSVMVDPADGHLVISAPIVDTVLKIARTYDTAGAFSAGDVIWRLGGERSDFTFADDAGFDGQHCARILEDGRLILFDNGLDHGRYVAYTLDTSAMTATRVEEFVHDAYGHVPAAGSVQALPDGGVLVGRGSLPAETDAPAITELDADGEPVLHISLPDNQWTYRAFKHEWLEDGTWR